MNSTAITAQHMKAALPDMSSAVSLDGLDDAVTIYRDGLGIPHVKASTSHDAFFGQGFATSQDRLWQMEYDRRRAYGRWAEYVGPEGVEQDAMMRRFRLPARRSGTTRRSTRGPGPWSTPSPRASTPS